MRNPFRALGIAPEGLRGLNDEQIRNLVQTNYRFWAKIYHPDMGARKSSAKFKQVQAAYDELKNEAAFEDAKRRYLARRKDKLKELENLVSAAEAEQEMVQNKLLEFWGALHLGEEAAGPRELNAFSPRPCRIMIVDPFPRLLFSLHGRVVFPQTEDARSKELEIDSCGRITEHICKKVFYSRRDNPPKGVPAGWCSTCSGIPYYWARTGKSRKLEGITLCGSLPEEALQASDEGPSPFRSLLELGHTRDDRPSQVFQKLKRGFTWQEFVSYARLVNPLIKEFSQIVGCSCKSMVDARFFFLGQARVIEIL